MSLCLFKLVILKEIFLIGFPIKSIEHKYINHEKNFNCKCISDANFWYIVQ